MLQGSSWSLKLIIKRSSWADVWLHSNASKCVCFIQPQYSQHASHPHSQGAAAELAHQCCHRWAEKGPRAGNSQEFNSRFPWALELVTNRSYSIAMKSLLPDFVLTLPCHSHHPCTSLLCSLQGHCIHQPPRNQLYRHTADMLLHL